MSIDLSLYQQRLHLQKASFSLIEHEEAMVATVYRVESFDHSTYILKICENRKHYLRELYFLNQLEGDLPVPKIVQVVAPEPSLFGAILMACLPGAVVKINEIDASLAYEMGALLARLHLYRTKGYGDLIEPQGLTCDPRALFMHNFEESVKECRGHLSDIFLGLCLRYAKEHLFLLASVDGPCFVHRDFRPGNLVVQQGKLQGIIDWSSGRSSFAEEDFCQFEHTLWPIDASSKKVFLEGYSRIRPIPDYREIMPLLRLYKALATVGFTLKQEKLEGSYASLYANNRRFLDDFFHLST